MCTMNAASPQDDSPDQGGKPTLGQQLRAARERRGTKLVKIAAETRVGVHYLAALEHSDYDELPGEVFTKSYVRAYAEFLDLDPDEMAALYLGETVDRRAAESAAGDEKIVREMSRVLNVSPDRSISPLWIAGGAVVLLLAIAVGWWLFAEPTVGEPLVASELAANRKVTTEPEATQPELPQVIEQAKIAVPADAAPAQAKRVEREPTRTPTPTPPPARETPGDAARTTTAPSEMIVAEKNDVAQSRFDVAVISDFGVGSEVRDRNLIGRGVRFTEGSEVWFWNRILEAEPGTILQHVWLHEGTEVSRVSLAIGASHWRTQSRKTLFPGSAGQWAVEVRDPTGKTLARAEFLCDGPA